MITRINVCYFSINTSFLQILINYYALGKVSTPAKNPTIIIMTITHLGIFIILSEITSSTLGLINNAVRRNKMPLSTPDDLKLISADNK